MRKKFLSQFFQQQVQAEVEKHLKKAVEPEEATFVLLTGHRISDACSKLLEAEDYRLATVLPLIGGDRKTRAEFQKQLDEWRTSGALAEIQLPIRTLYELLAGNTSHSEGIPGPLEDQTPSFSISERFDLDWKRTFALRLWYGIYEDQAIEEAVRRYERDFKAADNVQQPVPWYEELKGSAAANAASESNGFQISSRSHSNNADRHDLLWGLLKVYSDEGCNLEEILHPRSYGRSDLDYRLAWQLRQIFSEKQIRDVTYNYSLAGSEVEENVISEQITTSFASQLEAEGLYEWAIFVLLHLNDVERYVFQI